jgi:hypothetical protein
MAVVVEIDCAEETASGDEEVGGGPEETGGDAEADGSEPDITEQVDRITDPTGNLSQRVRMARVWWA